MTIVFDTNVLMAAFGSHGLCQSLFADTVAVHDLVISEAILDELSEHLAGKFKMPAAEVKETIEYLREYCRMVEPAAVAADACRDADDLLILGTAAAGNADVLVTGDSDLLTLKMYGAARILTPRAIYDELSKR